MARNKDSQQRGATKVHNDAAVQRNVTQLRGAALLRSLVVQVAVGSAGLVALTLASGFAGITQAQEPRPGSQFVLGLGAGPAIASMSVSDENGHESGIALHGRIGVEFNPKLALLLEVDVQPFDVGNPVRAEAFNSIYILGALQLFVARGLYIRPAVGLQSRSWSGADPVTDSDTGPAIGLASGYELLSGRHITVAPEVYWRSAFIELEGGVSATLLGIRIVGVLKP
jgi:hypothetical protein